MEVTSPAAGTVAPAQPSMPPPPAPSSQLPLPCSTEDIASHVTVKNPLKRRNKGGGAMRAEGEECGYEEGGWRYTCYIVTVTGGNRGRSLVSVPILVAFRQYSDFLYLRLQLHRERPGAILTYLPRNQRGCGQYDPTFVDMRRAGLELLLHRCHIIPELRDADGLRKLLTSHKLLYREQIVRNDRGRGGDGGTGDVANREGGGKEGAALYGHLSVPRDSPLESYETIRLSLEEKSAEEKKKKKKKGGLLGSWFGRGAKACPQRELVLSPDNHFFELLGPYMLDLEKGLQTVWEEAYARGEVHSDLSVG